MLSLFSSFYEVLILIRNFPTDGFDPSSIPNAWLHRIQQNRFLPKLWFHSLKIVQDHWQQYLEKAHLTGNIDSNLTGNERDNTLAGNAGSNILDGGPGQDTVVFPNQESEYSVTKNRDGSMTVTGDGTDTLIGIEIVRFDGDRIKATKFAAPVPFLSKW